jgi:oligoendopeptidase F
MKDVKKWKTEWDLSIYYKNPKDPQIEKDLVEVEQVVARFVEKYKENKDYLKKPSALKEMLQEEGKIDLLNGVNKPLRYFHFLVDSGKATPDVYKKEILITERLRKIGNTMLPITLSIGKIPAQKQKEFLKSPELKDYKYHLERFFESAKYQLTEPEERILSLKSGPASQMWSEGFSKALQKKFVNFEGKIFLWEKLHTKYPIYLQKNDAHYTQI